MFLERKAVVGLSAYLRLLELSLDRSYRGDIAPLRDYYARVAVPPIATVITRLVEIGGERPAEDACSDEQPFTDRCRRGPVSTLRAWTSWCLRGGIRLNREEARLVIETLHQLSVELARTSSVDPVVFAPIRYDLRIASEMLLQAIPSRETQRRVQHVEHLHQAEHLVTHPFQAIVGEPNWLERA